MPAADGETPSAPPAGRPARPRPWVFVAWCAWLLAWLAPALLVAPATPDPRPWLEPAAAPAAVLAGAALFLVAAWPFWPALATSTPRKEPANGMRGGSPHPRRGRQDDERGGYGDPPRRADRVGGRLVGHSAVEVLILTALAAPMLVAARSLGGALQVWPTVATGAGLAVFAIGLRVAAAGLGEGAARRLMCGALLVAGGPPAVYYAAAETIGAALPWLPAASPVVALVQAGTDGWPDGAWPQIVRLYLWPMVGVGLGVLGTLKARSARASHV
ncbi:MAG: hypothetical protein R6X20_14940 [Phycisphaerae bacterium]